MFLESIIIASICIKVLRKRFLKPVTIGLIASGGYSGNINYSKKVMICLMYMEQTDGCTILPARNRREYRSPVLPHLSVNGFCVETRTVYEIFGCYFHSHSCLLFRDDTT